MSGEHLFIAQHFHPHPDNWAYGAGDVVIDGVTVPGDQRRDKGVHANAAMRVNPVLKNTGLVDLTGGSAVFYQTQVKLVKV
jgi:tetrathionate reductase subunit A